MEVLLLCVTNKRFNYPGCTFVKITMFSEFRGIFERFLETAAKIIGILPLVITTYSNRVNIFLYILGLEANSTFAKNVKL